MRILLMITDYGSFNNFISEVAVNLINKGHDVHVICSKVKVIDYEDKYDYEKLGINFHFLDFPRSFNPISQYSASKKINAEIESIEPDLINVHFTTAIFTTLLFAKPRFFMMGTIHGIGYPKVKGLIKKFIFKFVETFCFRRLDQIYLINRFDYNLVRESYPDKAFMYNSYGVGCDFERFNPDRVTDEFKSGLRDKLAIGKHDFVIAFTGRFVSFKGFDLLIRSMLQLSYKPEYKHIKLLLIGGEDAAHPTGLTKEESEFCSRNKQIIKIGFTADVNHFLSITDLFVFPSVKEGMPVCIMEALAMGVPVVTSDSRGCHDLVEHRYNGLILGEDPSVEEITAAILRLFWDKNLLAKFRRNALRDKHDLNRDMYVKHQVHIYDKVIAQDTSTGYSMQYN